MRHIVPVLMEVEAPLYEDALYNVIDWITNHREGHALDVWPQGTLDVRAETFFERDGVGQRVLYLPSENIDEEAGEVEVIIEDDKEEKDEEP